MLTHEDLAVGSYRFAVSRLIPQMTQVALQTHKKELMRETPDFFLKVFLHDAQWKRSQAFRAGQHDKRHSLAILSVPGYPNRSRLPVMAHRPRRRGSNQFHDTTQEFSGMMPALGQGGTPRTGR